MTGGAWHEPPANSHCSTYSEKLTARLIRYQDGDIDQIANELEASVYDQRMLSSIVQKYEALG